MQKTLDKAAKAGRYGDNRLLHVSDAELQGLASLHPKGELPKNPTTGLPEAFFFLPFLAGLGSLAGGAATAAAAIPAAATAATTAASAIPAAATIGGALGTAALPAAEAATLGATTAASALPAATAAIPAAIPAATTALPAATAATAAPNALAAAAPAALTKGFVPVGLDSVVTGSTTPLIANPAAATTSALPSVAANPATAPLFKPALASATENLVTPSTIAGPSSVTSAPATLTPPAVTPSTTIPGLNATPPTLLGPAPANTTPGLSSLFSGGNMSQMMQMMAPLATMMGGSDMPELEDDKEVKLAKTKYHRGRVNFGSSGDNEHDYFPDDHYSGRKNKRKFAMGGLVTGYAEGGLASMDKSSGEMSDKDLIEATRQALIEQSPDAQALVSMFIATFGQSALADLMNNIQQSGEGLGEATSDGLSDSVPATVTGKDGQQGLASLSEGEFVVPSDVVSGLGNGSTDAGAKQLNGMMQRVRSERSNGAKQPKAIDPNAVMPV